MAVLRDVVMICIVFKSDILRLTFVICSGDQYTLTILWSYLPTAVKVSIEAWIAR